MSEILSAAIGVAALLLVLWQWRPLWAVAWVSPDWLEAHLASDPELLVVDLRSAEEYRFGHIKRAISAPKSKIRQLAGLWPPEQRIVLVARSGYREIQAWQWLRHRDFRNVHCLRGGMLGWAMHRVRQTQEENLGGQA